MQEQQNRRTGQLILLFCLWKALLLMLAAFCPGPGYDTSGLILLDSSVHRHTNFASLLQHDRASLNLFRWDALYFVGSAHRGKIYEQEWAFSWMFSNILRLRGQFTFNSVEPRLQEYIKAGIVISNICHLISVRVLYRLLTHVLGSRQSSVIPFIASLLHIMTPASLFMSAPYTESLFALLNMSGMLHYARSKSAARAGNAPVHADIYKLTSGLCFAAATLVRSNGLLSGSILLYDVAGYLPRLMSARLNVHDIRRLFISIVAGSFLAMAFVAPQYVAYKEFCNYGSDADIRPWCEKTIPSIYSWVQSHYWNVGLFRYWTLSNLPLFLLAAPMLWLLIASAVAVLRTCSPDELRLAQARKKSHPTNDSSVLCNLPELAIPQLLLAVSALTSFHVQIVNRLASGYPIWYLVVASWIVDKQTTPREKTSQLDQWIVRGVVMYALVQGVLYANFLPPA